MGFIKNFDIKSLAFKKISGTAYAIVIVNKNSPKRGKNFPHFKKDKKTLCNREKTFSRIQFTTSLPHMITCQ